MSIATEISRIQEKKGVIRNKLVTLGLATSTDNLDTLATAIDGIDYHSGISAVVLEGSSYTIPKGYHDGSGVVEAQTDAEGDYERYTLQPKTVTPTKSAQTVTCDQGHYGLSSVTVNAIPDAYQDVSQVDAAAANVLAGKKFVTADGTLTAGTMTNRGAVSKTLDTATTSYTVPAGYHNGSGEVSIVPETKTVSPSTSAQTITPSSGKVLSKVTVNAMPVVERAATTLGADVDPEDNTLVLTASNNQGAGYLTAGGNSTAQKIVELSVSGKTVTASVQGVEDAAISADVATATQATPGISVSTAGLITASATQTEGYVSAGTKSATKQLTVQAAKTVTPTKSSQTAVAKNVYTTGVVTVGAIPDAYQDVTAVDVIASEVRAGKKFVAADGTVVEGTMRYDTGGMNASINPLTQTEAVSLVDGYISQFRITITDDLEKALAAI